MELIQRLIRKAAFSKKYDLRLSTTAIYQSKQTLFLGWCDRRGIYPCKTTIPLIAEFFLHLYKELGLSVTADKGYSPALSHIYSLTGMDLATNPMVSRMFHCFERSCPPHEIRPPDWKLSLVLSLKLASDKHLTWKMSLVSAKRVSELHSLSFWIHHSRGWRSCIFSFLPDFMAKTQNPSAPDSFFEEFPIPSLDDFVGGDQDELLLCSIRSLRKYLSQTEQFRPGFEGLFISTEGLPQHDFVVAKVSHFHGPCFCVRRGSLCAESKDSQS